MRQALHTKPGARLCLHLSGEALTWASDGGLIYERLDRSGRHISVALDGDRARHVFAQRVQNEGMGCDQEPKA
ncbi:hypothetical protein EBBID32_23590 [Sphingobium indicum BiD32]|uniref:Uncharacterized protein n=2 Tax=Sphingobium indicum TaxID=332055 RepID=N1MMN4_9SPHN|nr:hypothetical protein EBBID32_23590 [Sphingobium indicum BiD32]